MYKLPIILKWITLWYPSYIITTLFLLIEFPITQKLTASWYFNNSFCNKPFLSLKMWKITTSLQVTCWNRQNAKSHIFFKNMLRLFLKSATYMRMDVNRDQEIYQKVLIKNSNQRLKMSEKRYNKRSVNNQKAQKPKNLY